MGDQGEQDPGGRIGPLLVAAREAADRAYAPYSGFPVGAALEGPDGSIHSACNVENSSYGLSICAERAAVWSAVAAGLREFRRLAIWAPQGGPVPPCGACRQVLAEFARDLPVEAGGPGGVRHWSLSVLLPDRFGVDPPSGGHHPSADEGGPGNDGPAEGPDDGRGSPRQR